MSEWIITSDTQNHIPAEDIRRVKDIRTEITRLRKTASKDVETALALYITESGNSYFNTLVSEIGDTEARSYYMTHLLTGSTPPPNMKSFDYLGRGEAELSRILEHIRDVVANEKNGM